MTEPKDPPGGLEALDQLLAKLVVESGLLKADDVRRAQEEQSRQTASGKAPTLSQLLAERHSVSLRALLELLDKHADERDRATLVVSSTQPTLPSARLAPDLKALGRYEIVRELGRGGMGVVYEAFDTQLRRKVALKLMLGHINADPQDVATEEERFVREAQMAAQLRHPNIVTIFDAGVLEGRRYEAMELIDGHPLSDWRGRTDIPLRRRIEVVRDVGRAVQYAHERGILHRDLKPRNVLIDASGRPFVTDFGLAKPVEGSEASITGSGVLVGTPAYMSPEQAQGLKSIDRRSDVYSLGAILYEMLTSKPPFLGETAIATVVKVLKDPVVAPSELVKAGPRIDPAVEAVCLKALAKDPADRYPTAEAMVKDLDRWLAGDRVDIALPAPRRRARRVRLAAAAAAVVLATAAAGILWTAKAPSEYGPGPLPPENLSREETREHAVNLMSLVDPAQDAVLGAWRFRNDGLAADAGEHSSLEIPYEPPEEYDFRAVFTRTEGTGDVLQRLHAAGKSFSWTMGAQNNTVFAFGLINGEWADGANPSIVRVPSCLETGRVHTSKVQVRKDGVRALLDGKLVAEWKTGYGDVSAAFAPRARNRAALGVGALKSGVAFHQLELVEITGQGMRARSDAPALPVRALPPESAWIRAVNLLAMADPRFDAVEGAWTRADAVLRSDDSRHARIALPYRPPEEYDLRVVFTRGSGNGDVNVILTAAGRPFLWMMGGYENRVFGFELVANEHANANPTTRRELSCLENGKTRTAVLRVRKDGIQAFLDGAPVSQWRTDFSDLGIHREWRLPGGSLGLGTFQSPTTFHFVELLPVEGRGAPLRLEPPTIKPMPVAPTGLAPGLVGEYFLGTHFESLALRRIDPVPSRSGKGPAWPGGPADGFSCRWTGFLRVPKTGTYSFSARSDDGVRVKLGATPVLDNWSIHAETTNQAECFLEEGLHALTVEHFDEKADSVLALVWGPEGEEPAALSPEHLFHASADFQAFAAPARPPHLLHVMEGHAFSVWSVAASPDGTRAASGSYDKTARVWDLGTGKEVRAVARHNATVTSVAFTPEGARLLTGSWDGTVALWGVSKGERLRLFEGHRDRVQAVAVSPDGRRALSGSWDKTVALWDLETGGRTRVFEGHADRVYSVSFSPDGSQALSAGWDRTVVAWDLETGAKVRAFEGHRAKLQCARFSPDGKTVASAGRDGLVRLWDAETGAERRALAGHSAEIMSIAFSPDGKRLLSGSNDQTLRLWDLETGKVVRAYFGHGGFVECVAFVPDGRRAVSAGADRTVRLWHLED